MSTLDELPAEIAVADAAPPRGIRRTHSPINGRLLTAHGMKGTRAPRRNDTTANSGRRSVGKRETDTWPGRP